MNFDDDNYESRDDDEDEKSMRTLEPLGWKWIGKLIVSIESTDGKTHIVRIWCANACARIRMRLYTEWKFRRTVRPGFFMYSEIHRDFIHQHGGDGWILCYIKRCRFPYRFDKLAKCERMQRCNGNSNDHSSSSWAF